MTNEERLRQALRPGRALYSKLSSSVSQMIEGARIRLPVLLDRTATRVSRGVGAAESTVTWLARAARARKLPTFAWEKPLNLALVAASVLLAWVSLYAVYAIATQLVALVTDMINQALTQFGYPAL